MDSVKYEIRLANPQNLNRKLQIIRNLRQKLFLFRKKYDTLNLENGTVWPMNKSLGFE